MNPALRAVQLTPKRGFAPLVASMFGGTEPGVVLDPSYTRSLFQDAAMTIPAAVGMPVFKALDLSGRGNTVTFTDVTLQQDDAGLKYLNFNGTSSAGSTSAIDFTGTDSMTVVCGIRKTADVGLPGIALELADAAGSFFLAAPRTGGTGDFGARSRGTVLADATTAANYPAPFSAVATITADISSDALDFRINGASVATAATDQGAGNYGNHPLYIGGRAATSLFTAMRLYGLIVRGAASTAGQIADAERYMARLTGVNF